MNNEILSQQQKQKPAQGASSKAGRGKPKGIPRGVWKEIPLNKLRPWEKNVRATQEGARLSNDLKQRPSGQAPANPCASWLVTHHRRGRATSQ